MLRTLDARLHLRQHYADADHDLLSRLWPADASAERFHDYYLRRVSVVMDDYSRVLVIQVQAYTPAMAQAIAAELVAQGEDFMNEINHRIASEQVVFIEQQVNSQGERMLKARQALLAYQNAHGLVSPRAEVQNLSGVVAEAEGRLATLEVRRRAQAEIFTSASPVMQSLDAEIAAVRREIEGQRARMVSGRGGAGLNRSVEEQERLQAVAEFSTDVYKTALVALEKARIEATRKLKNVAVVQSPALPEYPLEPRRLYNIVVFVLMTLMLAGVVRLLGAIVRDHRD
jgi:capsular polysaccharide transport system permease protein